MKKGKRLEVWERESWGKGLDDIFNQRTEATKVKGDESRMS